ncbi:MAG TPA: porin family protein [Chitinophagaceae bacterium]|nr:porin family protein [Chitinophagaceae bacterium]
MKKIIMLSCFLPLLCLAQDDQDQKKDKKKKTSMGFGIKAGMNFANVRGTSSITTSNQSGFMGGLFLAPPSKGIMAFRSEIIYSKQGYNFATQTNTGQVDLDYIIMPNLMAFNITKFVQIQVGGQMAFLLNAKADTAKGNTTNPYSGMMDLYNRFDYGFAGGIEIHPVSGLLLGARLNISMGDLYKDPSSFATGSPASMIPKVDVKNNVLQVFAGWTF